MLNVVTCLGVCYCSGTFFFLLIPIESKIIHFSLISSTMFFHRIIRNHESTLVACNWFHVFSLLLLHSQVHGEFPYKGNKFWVCEKFWMHIDSPVCCVAWSVWFALAWFDEMPIDVVCWLVLAEHVVIRWTQCDIFYLSLQRTSMFASNKLTIEVVSNNVQLS